MDDRLPSQVNDDYWISARNREGKQSINPGKWMIFVPKFKLDETWNIIKRATVTGQLGISSKTSTNRPNPNARSDDIKVICVHTYDYKDEADVMRVRQRLSELGFNQKLNYKTDDATHAGRYSSNSSGPVSMYAV